MTPSANKNIERIAAKYVLKILIIFCLANANVVINSVLDVLVICPVHVNVGIAKYPYFMLSCYNCYHCGLVIMNDVTGLIYPALSMNNKSTDDLVPY